MEKSEELANRFGDQLARGAKRLKELEKKLDNEGLTNKEMEEYRSFCPDIKDMGIKIQDIIGNVNVERSISNLRESATKAKVAWSHECYREVIDHIMTVLELYLKIYIQRKDVQCLKKEVQKGKGKLMFGTLMEICKNLGFDSLILEEIRDFNKWRIQAIHQLTNGEINYTDLRQPCEKAKSNDFCKRIAKIAFES